ncbi:sulfatase family protein [Oceaniglobus trochenteri]|uniref:sulfatase family protein n=1 Tax=Oceaniglobus trochenteri TaxID=2763260 RepID=UPI001CFFA805|nr:sulfatase-like hydrolase/transferase [Oceaniglobus trochenteri]
MQPNILILITDQQRWDSLGCNGNVFAHTPNMDAIAADGVNFDNAHTPFPICTPARATMWTGVLPHAHGVTENRYGVQDVLSYESKVNETVFEPLHRAGYTTAYFGKWHLGEDSSERFDIWDGFNSRGGHWEDGRQSFQGGTYKPEIQTDRMIEFLDSDRAKKAPFVAVQSWYPPHNPFTAPLEYYEHYRGKGVPFPGYYAAISALDDYIGRIRRSLADNGLAENTLVIFFSDHGETFNLDPLVPHKCCCLDTAVRVPFLMAGPGVPQGSLRVSVPVGLEDLAPTLLAAAGLPAPDHYQGRNLFDAIEGADDWRTSYYIQNEMVKVHTLQRALRTDRWKLILSWDEAHELYDLRNDPEELFNVFNTPREHFHDEYRHFPDFSADIVTLCHELHDHAERVDDPVGQELAGRVLRQKRPAAAVS